MRVDSARPLEEQACLLLDSGGRDPSSPTPSVATATEDDSVTGKLNRVTAPIRSTNGPPIITDADHDLITNGHGDIAKKFAGVFTHGINDGCVNDGGVNNGIPDGKSDENADSNPERVPDGHGNIADSITDINADGITNGYTEDNADGNTDGDGDASAKAKTKTRRTLPTDNLLEYLSTSSLSCGAASRWGGLSKAHAEFHRLGTEGDHGRGGGWVLRYWEY